MRLRPTLITTVLPACAFGISGWIATAVGVVREQIGIGFALSNWLSIGALIGALVLMQRRTEAYRRMQASLREANARLQMAEEVAHLGHWRFDVSSRTLLWSDEVYRVYGLVPNGGKPEVDVAIDAFHPDDRPAITEGFRCTLRTGAPYEVSVRLRRPDATLRHVACSFRSEVDENGRVIAVFGTIHDVTEQERAQRRRRQSDARYRLLAENTSELVMLGHDDGRRSYISPAATRLLGFTPEELGAMRLRDYVHPDDLQRLYATTARLSGGETEAAIDYRALHKDGRWIWVEGFFRRISGRLEPDDPTIVATFRSIEERRAHARELEEAKEKAETATRAKSEFLANMSHELRTPLTGLLGVCDLLVNDPGANDSQRRLSGLAADSGRVLLTVVNDILDFSRIEAGQLRLESLPIDLRALAESTAALVDDKVRAKHLQLRIDIAADAPDVILGDPIRLRQVLLNLLGNAIKFTERGGVSIRIDGTADSSRLRVTVADTGVGIAPDVLQRLFDRFSQADTSTARKFGGSGLGLAICRQIVTMMGGTIAAESRPGAGSSFWFEIPCVRAEPAREGPSPLVADAPRRKLRLLLAEDNAVNREIISCALKRQGHEVIAAADGAQAFQAFTAGRFDVVLMDIQMPGTDGLAATASIRALETARGDAPTPIVALTANALEQDVRCYLASGMNAHVAKPVVWQELFALLEKIAAPRAGAPPSPAALLIDGLKSKARGAGLFSRSGRRQIVDLLSNEETVEPERTGTAG